MNRAYSVLDIKSVDDERGIITGMATTPSADRAGDIVKPEGATFALPIPLLYQHDPNQPIGRVIDAKVTKAGIKITAEIARGVTAGIDEAWKLIKSGLVRGLSIGFRGIDVEQIPNSWGVVFEKWEWLELSAVTIPANAEASIQTIKSFDRKSLAALGRNEAVVRITPAGASAKTQPVMIGKDHPMTTKKIGEQIADFEAERGKKQARLETITEKTGAEKRSMDAAEQEEFDTLVQDIEGLDGHIKRLRTLEQVQAKSAKPARYEANQDDDDDLRRRAPVQVKNTQKLDPGIRFARYAKCLAIQKMDVVPALQVAEHMYKGDDGLQMMLKANVPMGTTAGTYWLSPLIPDEVTTVVADFADYLRPRTILGRFGNGGIPALNRVGFRMPLVGQTSGGSGYWVGEGKAIPVTSFNFSRETLDPLKVGNIAAVSIEAVRDSSPSADMLVRDALAGALAERLDRDFIDPEKTADAGISPASITQGVSAIPSAGITAADVRTDVKAIFSAFIAANNTPTSGVWIMPARIGLALSQMYNDLGNREFPGVSMLGGTFQELPVIASEYLEAATAGDFVALVNARDVFLADDGGVSVSASIEAALEMDNDPAMDGTGSVTESTVVSMFQTEGIAFKAVRTINWKRRRASGVQLLSEVNWGAAETP